MTDTTTNNTLELASQMMEERLDNYATIEQVQAMIDDVVNQAIEKLKESLASRPAKTPRAPAAEGSRRGRAKLVSPERDAIIKQVITEREVSFGRPLTFDETKQAENTGYQRWHRVKKLRALEAANGGPVSKPGTDTGADASSDEPAKVAKPVPTKPAVSAVTFVPEISVEV